MDKSLTKQYRDAGIQSLTESNYSNGKLTTKEPTMLMIYWNRCGYCVRDAPAFIETKDCSRWKTMVVEVDEVPREDLIHLTKGVYKGMVPFIGMFDKNGNFTGKYEQKVINGGCLKYEYHLLTGEGDAGKC